MKKHLLFNSKHSFSLVLAFFMLFNLSSHATTDLDVFNEVTTELDNFDNFADNTDYIMSPAYSTSSWNKQGYGCETSDGSDNSAYIKLPHIGDYVGKKITLNPGTYKFSYKIKEGDSKPTGLKFQWSNSTDATTFVDCSSIFNLDTKNVITNEKSDEITITSAGDYYFIVKIASMGTDGTQTRIRVDYFQLFEKYVATETYDVIFHDGAQGALAPIDTITELSSGSGVLIPAGTSVNGWTMQGWTADDTFTTSNDTVIDLLMAGDSVFPQADVNYYAVYKLDNAELYSATPIDATTMTHYTVTLDAQTGTVTPTTLDVIEGTTCTLLDATCTVAGWDFLGWSTTTVASTTDEPTLVTTEYLPSADITLYAVYSQNEAGSVVDTTALNADDISGSGYNTYNFTSNGISYEGYFFLTGGKLQINIGKTAAYFGNTSEILGLSSIILTRTTSGSAATADVYQLPSFQTTVPDGAIPVGQVVSGATDTINFVPGNGNYFLITPSNNYFQIMDISIIAGSMTTTYNSNPGASSAVVEKPTFTLLSGEYNWMQTTMINVPTATTVYYTIDGTDPTNTSMLYTENEEIAIDSTTTLKAIAYDVNDNASEIASILYTINMPMTFATLADFNALDEATKEGHGLMLFSGRLVVSFVHDGVFFLQDETGYSHGYDWDLNNAGIVSGDTLINLQAEWSSNYHNLSQIGLTHATILAGTASVTPTVITTFDELAIDRYVSLKSILLSDVTKFSLDTTEITFDTNRNLGYTANFEANKTYDFEGFYTQDDDTFEFQVTASTEVNVDPTSLDKTETTAIYFDGQTIHNPDHESVLLVTAIGTLLGNTTEDIDMSSKPNGIYLIITPSKTIKIAK